MNKPPKTSKVNLFPWVWKDQIAGTFQLCNCTSINLTFDHQCFHLLFGWIARELCHVSLSQTWQPPGRLPQFSVPMPWPLENEHAGAWPSKMRRTRKRLQMPRRNPSSRHLPLSHPWHRMVHLVLVHLVLLHPAFLLVCLAQTLMREWPSKWHWATCIQHPARLELEAFLWRTTSAPSSLTPCRRLWRRWHS